MDRDRIARELVDAGRWLAGRGLVPATSGNLSARDGERFLVTRSGLDKGQLTPADLLDVDLEGRAATGRPSAETLLHLTVYRLRPAVACVLHTHSARATVLGRHGDRLRFQDYEIQKAFAGVTTHEGVIEVPIFPNDQDMPRLAALVGAWLQSADSAYGFVLRGHGLYTWGATVDEARRHVEAFEFLFECELLERSLRGRP